MSVSAPHENVGLSINLFMPSFVEANPACGLPDTLVAFWFGNRSAGIADDVHSNDLDLTDINTVTSAAGHVYPLARQYTAANLEYHTRPGDDALLSTGDVDFTLAVWVYMDSNAASMAAACKWDTDPNNEYWIGYSSTSNRFLFVVSDDGTVSQTITANSLGIPAINTWYLLVGWHDSVANTINIQVNNGTVDSLAHSTGVFDSAARFQLGAQQALLQYWDGRIAPTMFWKSAPGGGGVLTDAQRTCLFNGGAGLQYGELT